MGFLTDTSLCIGCKACEVACKQWNSVPEDGLNLLGVVLRQHRRARGFDLAARGVHRADRAGSGSGRRRGWAALADVVGRLQALHARRLPRRLPDRCAVPYRVRHGRRPGGHLQRLRLLRSRLPVRGHRPARGRRPGVEVHAVLRPAASTIRHPRARRPARPSRSSSGPSRSCASARWSACRNCTSAVRQGARLYGDDPDDGVGGAGAFFLLLDEPEVYGLPPDPVVPTRDVLRPVAPDRGVGADVRRQRRRRFRRAAPMTERQHRAGTAGAGGVAPTRTRLSRRPNSPRTTGVPSSRRRRGTPTSRPISSSAGSLPVPRLSRPERPSPAGRGCAGSPGFRRSRAITGSALRAHPRPRPTRALLHDAAGRQADVADVDGHLAALGVRPRAQALLLLGNSPTCSPLPARAPKRLLRGAAGPCGWVAAALAPALATYTGVLIADTATPAWKEAGGTITAAFAAGALASGAGVGLFAPLSESGRRGGWPSLSTAGEVGAVFRMEKAAGLAGETFTQGRAGRFARAAETLLVGGGILAGADPPVTHRQRRSPAPRCWPARAASVSPFSRPGRRRRATRNTPSSRSGSASSSGAACAMIARVSMPAGSVPNALPQSPPSRVAQ